MYERFTDRARKVIALADEAAKQLRSPLLDSEHILLGLLREGTGVAAHVLANLEIEFDTIVRLIEATLKPASELPDPTVIPERRSRLPWMKMAAALRRTLSPHELPLAAEGKKLIEQSIHEARALGHNYVGTEHLLLGLLRRSDSVAAEILSARGLNLDDIRRAVLDLLGHDE